MKTTLVIKGTHCESCKALIEEVFVELPGVKHVQVDFATGRTELEHTAPLDAATLQKELTSIGDYKVDAVSLKTES